VAGKSVEQRGTEEAPENSKESSHSAHANEIEFLQTTLTQNVSQKYLPVWILLTTLCLTVNVSGGGQPQLHQNDDICTYYAMTKQHN
jgi:hypothetical protein